MVSNVISLRTNLWFKSAHYHSVFILTLKNLQKNEEVTLSRSKFYVMYGIQHFFLANYESTVEIIAAPFIFQRKTEEPSKKLEIYVTLRNIT